MDRARSIAFRLFLFSMTVVGLVVTSGAGDRYSP